jgi:hypothetical protein
MTTIRCYHSVCKPFNALSVMKEIDEDLDDKYFKKFIVFPGNTGK